MTDWPCRNAGFCTSTGVELDEMRQPIHVYSRTLCRTARARAGCRRPSVAVEFGPSGTELSVGYVSDGCANPPKGVRGGGTGGASDQFLIGPDGHRERLESCAQVTLTRGDRLLSISCGGGGYGDPTQRDRDLVRRDLQEGRISTERARPCTA